MDNITCMAQIEFVILPIDTALYSVPVVKHVCCTCGTCS